MLEMLIDGRVVTTALSKLAVPTARLMDSLMWASWFSGMYTSPSHWIHVHESAEQPMPGPVRPYTRVPLVFVIMTAAAGPMKYTVSASGVRVTLPSSLNEPVIV